MRFVRLAFFCLLLSSIAAAESTRTWVQTKYDDFEKGSTHGVAINSDGNLALAPAFSALFTSPSTYIWDLAADAHGNVYAAAGSPARVYKLTPDGKASIIFAAQELQVQALAIAADGTLYAATSPDGKVYKIARGGPAPGKSAEGTHTTAEVAAAQEGAKPVPGEEKQRTAVEIDSSYSASIFFDPRTKYIWALSLDNRGGLYVGTGDRGEIYRVATDGRGAKFFQSDEAQIRALALDNSGNLIAGTDGSGLIYRISPEGEGFVLYSAPKKEITALAIDSQGNIYAAGAGEKRGPGPGASSQAGPPVATPSVVTLAPQSGPPSSTSAAPTLAPLPPSLIANLGGSEVYRISPDGSPRTLWSSKEDLVYALAFDSAGRLLAGTGNKGKIYAINGRAYTDLAKASANQVTAFARTPKGGMYAATSNLGKIFELGPGTAAEGTYESDVFDGHIFSKWGRLEVRGTGKFDLYARSGNVDNPDRNWSQWAKVDLTKDVPPHTPSARYVQWKAVLYPGTPPSTIDSVTLFYLPKNVAPEVDEVAVTVGARVVPGARGAATTGDGSADAGPPTVPDKHSIAVKWKAHDTNDDDLAYSVYYRADGESQWKLLRDDVESRYINLESDLFADGGYNILIVASDAPSHSPGDTLTGQSTSPRFEVDNTPPHIESLNASVSNNQVHVTFRAVDSFSPIAHAEYSVDAGDWQIAEPVGQISDYRIENYDFNVAIPAASAVPPQPTEGARPAAKKKLDEHTIVIRVFDRYDNVGVGKSVVRTAPSNTP
jgi:sugar lactone lactonase YvrE